MNIQDAIFTAQKRLSQAFEKRVVWSLDDRAAVSSLCIALIEMSKFHPRAFKLLRKKKNFIVIADDEPYFIKAYDMIRKHEQEKGTWTAEDERLFKAAFDKRATEVLKVG